MGVALDHHDLVDRHCAEGTDPTQIVAGQINEHHVFCPLFRIREELSLECEILCRVRPPRPRARDRSGMGDAVADPRHEFGRRADDRQVTRTDDEHEGRGVHEPKRPIHRKRVATELNLEPERWHNLEGVARDDVVDGDGDIPLERFARQVGFGFWD